MNYKQAITSVETEWEPDTGFFWRVRLGEFRPMDFHRARSKLAVLTIAEDAELPRRLVSLLWYIPMFMRWQEERVQERGGDIDAYVKAVNTMTNEVERLLGVP